MKLKETYIFPTTDTIAMAACNATLQASHGYPQVSVDDNSITYEQTTDDSFGSDESVAARKMDWEEDWEEEEESSLCY